MNWTTIPLADLKMVIREAVYEGILLALKEYDLEKKEKELQKIDKYKE